MGSITWVDWSIWMIYAAFVLLVLWIYRTGKKEEVYTYFLPGVLIKLVGGVAFAIIYVYYYRFGDTFLYHNGASELAQTLIESPSDYFRLLLSGNGNLPPDLSAFSESIAYSRTYEEWAMVKILSPISLISFQSYLVTTFFMSLLSFVGSWKLFQVFVDFLPSYKKWCFVASFLTPSVVFWGGGIMKDTVTLFALNLLIYFLYFGVFKRRFRMLYLVGGIFCAYLIIVLKAYIMIAFLPGLFIAFYTLFRTRIRSVVLRVVIAPLLAIPLIVLSFTGLESITSVSSKYRAENIEWQVKGFHSWHTDVGGSTYDLGEIEYTAWGVTKKIPQALNVTFFRPYPWEARNPVVFIGALESLIFLGMFVYVLVRQRLKFILVLRKQPLLYGLFFFCLVFGFAVGFTSFNFGALARYKIPILAIAAFLLVYLIKQEENQSVPSDTL